MITAVTVVIIATGVFLLAVLILGVWGYWADRRLYKSAWPEVFARAYAIEAQAQDVPVPEPEPTYDPESWFDSALLSLSPALRKYFSDFAKEGPASSTADTPQGNIYAP